MTSALKGEGGSGKRRQKEQNLLISVRDKWVGGKKPSYMEVPLMLLVDNCIQKTARNVGCLCLQAIKIGSSDVIECSLSERKAS